MQDDNVEKLNPSIPASTEVALALVHLWNCVDAIDRISPSVLRATPLADQYGTLLPATRWLREAVKELQRIQFRLDISGSEVA